VTLSSPSFAIFDSLQTEIAASPVLQQLKTEVANRGRGDDWRIIDGLITVKGKVFVPHDSAFLADILAHAHGASHEGTEKTWHRLRLDFHVPGALTTVHDFVHACLVCQRNKTEQLQPSGLLQPLAVPTMVWVDIALDFVEGLPKVHGKSVILTIVDRLSKAAHFISLGHPYTAISVARIFFDTVVKLHGIPHSIVSDRDPLFTGHFWCELFTMADVQLQFSSAFHPQTDGQSKATNKIIAMYLCCLTGDRPQNWLQWLSWMEFCYNSSFQSSLRTTSFKAVYDRDPPVMRSYSPGEARLPAVHNQMIECDEFLLEVHELLEQAQQHHKAFYDHHHRPLEFTVGQWVWLRLLHRPMALLNILGRSKLGPKYYRP
jgi:hypothetical protein